MARLAVGRALNTVRFRTIFETLSGFIITISGIGDDMGKTLIIINPHAASGRAGDVWREIEPYMRRDAEDLTVAVTQRPEEVSTQLERAYQNGVERVISIGGDGTNNALVNAAAALRARHPGDEHMVYGILPVGTGRDWARNTGIPLEPRAAARWLHDAEPIPTDVGLLTLEGGRHNHFLNIASAGISGAVDQRVNRAKRRYPWTFLMATVTTLLTYRASPMRVWVDGDLWYEGLSMTVVVANGTTFGHGMKIAPNARIDDGLFDVVLIKSTGKIDSLMTLRKVYDGSHLSHPSVKTQQARHVRIDSERPLPIDMDGEDAASRTLDFQVQPHMIRLLGAPQ
jgi:YegS/Rv2252/BmrU family lipid kinase